MFGFGEDGRLIVVDSEVADQKGNCSVFGNSSSHQSHSTLAQFINKYPKNLIIKPSQNPNILSFCSGFFPFSPPFRPAFPQFHLLPFPHIVPNSLLPQPKFVLSSLQFLGCKHLFWPFTPFSHIIIILTNRYIEYIDEESKNVFLLGPCRLVGNWLGKIQSFWNKSMPPNNLCHLRPLLLDFSWPAHFWTGIS